MGAGRLHPGCLPPRPPAAWQPSKATYKNYTTYNIYNTYNPYNAAAAIGLQGVRNG